jgi:hypothetical protein
MSEVGRKPVFGSTGGQLEGLRKALSAEDRSLLEGARAGSLRRVQDALCKGADVRTKDERGMSAMEHAMGPDVHADSPWPAHPHLVEFLKGYMHGSR